jgi:Fic family protein
MQRIAEILKEQKQLRLKGNLYHKTQISLAYNSNRIEGSQLTEEQTQYMYETKQIDGLANVNDIIETTNHFTLFDYMLDTCDEILTETMIKQYHAILKSSTTDSKLPWFRIGDYKKLPNTVGNTETSSPEDVQSDIASLLKSYNAIDNKNIEDIIDFHWRFETIHPFQDGNGRIGRIIMFKECLRNNIMPFIIFDEYKLYYYRGLKEYKNISGYLIDTCLSAQDTYTLWCKQLLGL